MVRDARALLNSASFPHTLNYLHLIGNPQNSETSQTENTRRRSPALTLPAIFAGRAVTSQDQTAQLVQEVITGNVPKPTNLVRSARHPRFNQRAASVQTGSSPVFLTALVIKHYHSSLKR